MPDALTAALDRYRFGPPQHVEHIEKGGEWRVRSGDRVLRWSLTDALSADHIVRDARMLVTLEHHGIPAPHLLALDTTDPQQVVSVQHLLLPGARLDVEAAGLTERGWQALGAYLRALHDRGPVPPFQQAASDETVWQEALRTLNEANRLTPTDRAWLQRWWTLLPPAPLVLTHGFADPGWVVTDSQRELILGLTDWSVAQGRSAGHDFLRLPESALETVLEGYGPSGTGLFLRAKLLSLVQGAAQEGQTAACAEVFADLLQRLGLSMGH
ncbi:hypothetical protein [Deinococcus aquatilis]|uniref:hypothetical protein n=1 Tax=Deinococcus aquatilis TaxID=519440 RepID=UPI0003647EE0|nr:hypothetical protein [Deinococcus aquatilis]